MLRPQTKINTTLAALAQHLASYQATISGEPNTLITGISMNSKTVQPGDIYAAVAGARHHGANYIDQAVQAGAVAVITDDTGTQQVPQNLPYLTTTNLRAALAEAAALIYGNTKNDTPQVYGVTGTNGKTTTTYFLNALLEALQKSTGLIGTIETRLNQITVPSAFTTPEAPELHGLIAKMREEHIDVTAMEVSSHALDYRRTVGLQYHVAGFTNLTQDHLDLHGSMTEYLNAKARLFETRHSNIQVITLNGGAEPQWGKQLATRFPNAITLDLGPAAVTDTPDTQANWHITGYQPAGLGHQFTLAHESGLQVTTSVGMPGLFNIANAALAAVMVFAGSPRTQWEHITSVLEDPFHAPFNSAVPGRMEVISANPTVVVDFAHNPDGLTQALQAVNRAKQQGSGQPGRTIVVFGATGDRDKAKRPIMGQIAANHADVVIVTDDDPHYEDPATIRQAVLAGTQLQNADEQPGPEIIEISPRSDALIKAVNMATKHDVILAAGRGHETHQDIAGKPHEIDDREVLRQALVDHGFVTTGRVSTPGTD